MMGLVLVLGAIPDGTMIFYDGTSVPAGWQVVATFDGRFPRACTPAGSAGGQEKHTHTYIFGFTGYPNRTEVRNGYGGASGASDSHEHDLWDHGTIDSASNLPPYRKFLVIKKVGEGTGLPAGAVLFFEDSSFSIRWTVILKDSFPRATANTAEVGATGGSNGHYHTFEGWTSEPFSGTSASPGSYGPVSPISHVHHYTGWTLEDTTKPPYIRWFIVELTADTEDIPVGAIAMFDQEPSGSSAIGTWSVPLTLSAAGGDTANRLVRGAFNASQLGDTGGSLCHRHGIASLSFDASYDESESLCKGYGDCDDYYVSKSFAAVGHTHYLNLSDYHTDYTCVLPPYRCVLFRKKVSSLWVGADESTGKAPSIVQKGLTLVVNGLAGQFLELYSASGQVVLRRELRSASERLSLKGLPKGVYFAKAGEVKAKVLVK